MARELAALQEQIVLYQETPQEEFRRLALVHCFTDFANSVQYELINSELEALQSLCFAGKEFFQESGPELVEGTFRLQLIVGMAMPPQLENLASYIAKYSNPRELQLEMNALLSYLKSDESLHPIEKLKQELLEDQPDAKDIFKSALCFYVPGLIANFKTKHLARGLEDLTPFLEYLEEDLEECYAVLGGIEVNEILEQICNRKIAVRYHCFHECLSFLLFLIGIYEVSSKFSEKKLEIAERISEIYNFQEIFQHWLKTYPGTEKFQRGLAVLSCFSLEGKALELPLVYSPLKRLQIYLPVVSHSAKLLPDLFLKTLSHCIYYFEGNFKSLKSPVGKTNKFSTLEICIACLDVSGGNYSKETKRKTFSLFKEFIERFKESHRAKLVKTLIENYRWDKAISLLLDTLCRSFVKTKRYFCQYTQVLKYTLNLRPLLDYTETYQSSSKFLESILRYSSVKPKELQVPLKTLTEELQKALDLKTEEHSLALVVWSLQSVQDLMFSKCFSD